MASRQSPGQLLIVISALFATLVLVICQDELPDDVKEEGNVVEPFVEDDGKNISVREGKMINITCSIQNIGELTINWKQGQDQIYLGPYFMKKESEKHKYQLMNKTLIIVKAERTDNGEYTCYVMGATIAEQKHYVEVQYGPSKIQIAPSELKVHENRKVEFTCESDGVPPPTLNWRFNEDKMLPDSIQIKENGKKLVISRVSAKNSGKYTCIANNGIGNAVHNTTELTVIHSPILINPTAENVKTVIGTDVVLSCEHTAYPPANITWHFNNNIYPKQNNNVKLMLKNVTLSDEGVYECHLMNINKEPVTKKFQLKIESQADEAHSTTNYQQTEEVHKESSVGDHAAISTKENTENGSSSMKSLSAIASFLVFVFAVLCLS